MRKAKSRDFILIVCGILLMLLVGFVFTKTLMNIMVKVGAEEYEQELLRNVVSSSSKVSISGNGNFIGSTPAVSETTVSNFNVKVSNPGDSVKYSIKFCNMNDEGLKYESLWEGTISCSDVMGAKKSCDAVDVFGYVTKGNKRIKTGEVIEGNSCVQLVVDITFVSDIASEMIVSIDEYFLDLKMYER